MLADSLISVRPAPIPTHPIDLFEVLLMRLSSLGDDLCLEFVVTEGDGLAPLLVFLPWNTSFGFANKIGLVPRHFLACFTMPKAIVSSEPARCTEAFDRVVAAALEFVDSRDLQRQEIVVVGLSVGNAPATYVANELGARLMSAASGDRGDLMIWESPAARIIKERAIAKRYVLDDFTNALAGRNPIENLAFVGRGSVFVQGARDSYVPSHRSGPLIAEARQTRLGHQIVTCDAGHVRTLLAGVDLLAAEPRDGS